MSPRRRAADLVLLVPARSAPALAAHTVRLFCQVWRGRSAVSQAGVAQHSGSVCSRRNTRTHRSRDLLCGAGLSQVIGLGSYPTLCRLGPQVPKALRVEPHPLAGTTRINLTFRKCVACMRTCPCHLVADAPRTRLAHAVLRRCTAGRTHACLCASP